MTIYDELKESHGERFQELFTKLMQEKHGVKYHEICTNGKDGDRKVDGILNSVCAFAIYAPEHYVDSNTISKIKDDCEGFFKNRQAGHWSKITSYNFIIKHHRKGITPNVYETIEKLKEQYDFEIQLFTMDDIYQLANGYLPFSDDGEKIQEFKCDFTKVIEYIIETDFTAVPFNIMLYDEVACLVNKWNKKEYTFESKKLESLKQSVIDCMQKLQTYICSPYICAVDNKSLIIDLSSFEAGNYVRDEMRPQTIDIRKKLKHLLDMFFNFTEAATATVWPSSQDTTQVSTQVDTEVNTQVKLPEEKLTALLEYCTTARSRTEMQLFCGIKTAEYFRKNIVKPMLDEGLIVQTIPDKPNSRNQKYKKK